ncbi:21361_t:CDS:2 [Cetraspora pellucida]|uniref:21361_t:CDS:1 n=1 Tax=Cetraspora pellucida TaxID=1433469 RepID=A0A9N9DSU1_9GLOM|nr:21361_t:CDS:2 [Cetraspora pellucida]
MSLCKCYYNYKLFEKCYAVKIHKKDDKKINQSNFQEYLYIALYGSRKTLINEQEFKNIFINKLFLNKEKQESNDNENLSKENNDSNNNEQQLPKDNYEQIPKKEEQQIPKEHEEQQISNNTILIENLKKAIKDSNLEDLFLNKQIYNELQLNNRINEMINETENIDNLNKNQVLVNLIKQSDITFYEKNLLQQNRKVKLNKLQQDLLQYYKKEINQTEVLSQLREIQLTIRNEERLTAEQKVILFDLVNEKFQRNTQQEIIQNIQEKIDKETNVVKLQVDMQEEIDNDKDLTNQQKQELHNKHNEKIRNLRGNTEMIRMQQEIENESFLGNLLDERHHDKMIQLNASLNEDQKKILQDLRKQHLALLINKNYDSLLIEIQQSKDIDRLSDNNYYINRINEVREEYLDNLIKNSENINEISSNSEISQDIKVLNQTLLTENRNLIILENIRRQYYNDGLYDILKSAIENEKDVEKLKNTWLEVIDKLEQEYLTNDRTKHPIEEVENNNLTTNPNKADQERNLAETVERQIQDIINQYKKTLNVDDKRKFFPNIKNKPISDIIKKIYDTTKDK